MVQLTLRHLGKTFPGVVALHDVSLQVSSGEVFAIVGPSGCGKTTLLRLIAGLESLTTGQVLINDSRADHLPPHSRRIAWLNQRAILYPHLTVRENLIFGLPKGDRSKQITSTAEMLNLTNLLDRRPHQLSGGQQQRVALGRALVRDVRLWLFDEPFASLDGPLREELRQQLHLLQRQLAATMLLVTHEQDDALSLADRLAVLEGGRLVQVGTANEIRANPATPFARWLLKAPTPST